MTQITEAATIKDTSTSGRMLVRLIDAGQGSSGYYPASTLQAAAESGVFGRGLHLYADHPGEAERLDRPERSIRDIAGVLTEDARYDDDSQALVAEARVFGAWAPVLAEMHDVIGLSIRAAAEVSVGEHDGRPVTIVDRIVEAQSVDFVTRAGRGGKVLSLLESARPVREAMSSDVEHALELLFINDDSSWVVDHDPDAKFVIYRRDRRTWRTAYSYDPATGTATLDPAPVEVRRVVTYVPTQPTQNVPAPAGQTTTTQESREDTMPQIEEARLRQLEEDAGRVQQLTESVTKLTTERDDALAAAEAARATVITAQAAAQVAESGHKFTRLEKRGLMLDLPVTEAGGLDVEAMKARISEAVAEAEEAARAVAGRGFGSVSNVEGDLAAFDALFGGAK